MAADTLIKQRTPAATGDADKGQIGDGKDFISGRFLTQPVAACSLCRWFDTFRIRSGGWRRLCRFSGKLNPLPGADAACHFLQGMWNPDDVNIGIAPAGGLTGDKSGHTLQIPNLLRPCNGLDHSQDGQKVARHSTAIHAYADIYGNKALHIGRAQRPHDREAAAASVRPGSVGVLPFCFNHPELTEVHHV